MYMMRKQVDWHTAFQAVDYRFDSDTHRQVFRVDWGWLSGDCGSLVQIHARPTSNGR